MKLTRLRSCYRNFSFFNRGQISKQGTVADFGASSALLAMHLGARIVHLEGVG